jgi:hypothetical protein
MDISLQVDRLFRELPGQSGRLCRNPVTGSCFVRGADPIGPQKKRARLALETREWFARHAPPDAPPLPLCYADREHLKVGGLHHIVAWFARSLGARDYNYRQHPSFADYAAGVLASPDAPGFITKNEELRRRFPPRRLEGLDGGMYWDPPKPAGKRCRRWLG